METFTEVEIDSNTYLSIVFLTSHVYNHIFSLKKELTPKPYLETHSYWEYDHFNYTENGVVTGTGTLRQINIENWGSAINWYTDAFERHPLFNACEENLKNQFVNYPKNALKSYLSTIIDKCLNNKEQPKLEEELIDIRTRFIRDLNHQPYFTFLKTGLSGIIIQSPIIKIDDYVTIRQTTKADVESPKLVDVWGNPPGPQPAVFLSITMNSAIGTADNFNDGLSVYVTLFKLFGLGSINYLDYKISSDIIIDNRFGGGGGHGRYHGDWKHYFIKQRQEPKLIKFVLDLKQSVKELIVDGNLSYLRIGFARYTESLIEFGSFERRMANAMMGLEALISSNKDELSFRMQTRTAKIFSCIGFKALSVRNYVSKAYNVRSKFAHGEMLPDKDKATYIKLFGSLDSFVLSVINYLRVIFIIYCKTKISKDDFIKLIDDALVDNESNKKLKKLLQTVNPYLVQPRT